jgi:short-subunit dehydrogenase
VSDLFRGRWALVTGASSGLGEEFARQLAARGCHLILTARRGDRLAALAMALSAAHGVRAEVVALDLGAVGGAARLLEETARLGHPVELLVSNAGFGYSGRILESDPAQLADMVRLNCEAVVALTAALLPAMVARGAGGIVHVSSLAAFQPTPFMADYGATKAFVSSFSEAVSEEVRGSGVRVMALCPGPVPTGFQAAAGAQIAPSQRRAVMSAQEMVRRALADFAAGRAVSVPGTVNRLMLLASRAMPRRLLVRAVGRLMRAKLPS